MFLPLTSLDPELLQLLGQCPQTGTFDEHWFKQHLDKSGYFDYVLGLEWALMAEYLELRGVSPSGSWQLARKTSPAKTPGVPPLYVPATSYVEDDGGYYPALAPDVREYLRTAHFACSTSGAQQWETTFLTLAQLDYRLNCPAPEDQRLRQVLATGRKPNPGVDHLIPYVELTEPFSPEPSRTPPVHLDAFSLEFDRDVKPGRAWELLTGDLCLANYLLFILCEPTGRRVTVVVQVPAGYEDPVEARAVLPRYCEQRFQSHQCRIHALSCRRSALGIARPSWRHPSLQYLRK